MGVADVWIRYGGVPPELPDAHHKGVRYQAAPGVLLLAVDGVARFLIRQGNEIIIERTRHADDDSVRLFLLGSAFGALLHQRELLPLHASVIEVNGGGIAFLGHNGVGRSTLAAAFRTRGYHLIADDVCVVTFAENGTPEVHPSYPQIKLGADILKTLNMNPDHLPRIRLELGKYALSLADAFAQHVWPLTRLYVVKTTHTHELAITPLTGPAKFMALKDHTYRRQFLDGLGVKVPHFEQCATVAERVSVAQVVQPRHPFLLDELAARLEEDFRAGA